MSIPRTLFSLAPFLTLALAQDSIAEAPRLQAVREIHMGSTPGTESAHFRLDSFEALEDADAGPFGTVRWLQGPAMGEEHTWRAECEVRLLESGKRISHLEQLGPDRRMLNYRELTGSFGRRLQVSWSPGGRVLSTDRAGRQRRRANYVVEAGAAYPLALVELARRGRPLPEKMMVYQPLAGSFEELFIQVIRDVESRTLRLTRRDGSSAGSYRFEGNRLVSFRWQAGGMVATRIDSEEYLELTRPPQVFEASASLLESPGLR